MFKILKRFFDVIVSFVLLVILSPILILIAIVIKLDSKGPILFTQIRVGRRGSPFEIFKFRTMVDRKAAEIDQYNEGVVKKAHDSRVTKVGQFLRRSSVDELPQLINVLFGSMSLVGPRPILPEQKLVVPKWYSKRFDVLPGITGYAQVKGRRGLSWEDQLILDCEYVDRIGAGLDLFIIYRTFIVVFLQKDIFGEEGKNWRLYREIWKDK